MALGVAPRELAETRFALARALWPDKRDRALALDLANQASIALSSSEEHDDAMLVELDAWLEKHDLA